MRKILCKSKKVNKKGFTLVELIISVAILAVIAMALAQFVAYSSTAYRRVSSQTQVQQNCQDALVKISNIVRNSKNLVVTKSGDGRITMESVDHENKKILLVYVPDSEKNDYGKIFVDYDYVVPTPEPGEEPVYPDITAKAEGEEYNEYLLTDMVKNFTVDLATYKALDDSNQEYTVTQERTLDFVLTLYRNDKEYTQSYKASLRNSSPDGQTTELVIQMNESVNDEPENE